MRWRTPVHWIALVLAALIAVLSVIAIWTRNQVLDTDRYVETVAPLARDPAIQDLLVDRLTAAIAPPDRTAEFARGVLPRRAEPLATPIAAAVEGFVRDKLGGFVRSPDFAERWDRLSERTHAAAVELLTGEDEDKRRLQIVGDRLVVQLGPLVGPAREAVERAGLKPPEALASAEPEIVLGDASGVQSARGIVELLQTIAWVLPVVGVLLLIAAVFTAPDRRRGMLRAGMALVVGMAVLAIALGVGRSLYLDAATGADLPEDAASSAFDTLLRFLRDGLRLVFAIGLVIVLGAMLAGPSRPARALRGGIRSIGGRARRGDGGLGPVGRWIADYRRGIELSALVVGAIVLVAQSRPTGANVLAIALAVLAFVVVVELVAAAAGPAPASNGVEPS
jgi:hypothetical protein